MFVGDKDGRCVGVHLERDQDPVMEVLRLVLPGSVGERLSVVVLVGLAEDDIV